MHGHGHPELAKKLNDKMPMIMDQMFERVKVFIKGEVAAGSVEIVRPSQGDKGYVCLTWPRVPEKARNRGGPREAQRNIRGSNGMKVINMIREEGNCKRPFEEGRSSSEIKYEHCFGNLVVNIRSRLRRCKAPMIGRTGMRSLRAVGSTIHSMIKFPTDQGVVTMETSRETLRECENLERVQGSWKEVQWHQCEEKMSRIREQTILRARSNSRRGPSSGSASLEKTQRKEDVEEYLPLAMNVQTKDDKEKTGFHTEEGVYCFTHMPKELKNSAATLQKMMEKDVKETSRKLKRVNIKIDLIMSSFRVKEGKFLGHMITEEGLRADPEIIQVETDTQEKDKNNAKNDKTEHGMEKIKKTKSVKARGQQKSTPGKSKSNPTKPKPKKSKCQEK
nr:hypothetical protein [Tanacetum cinerariifolium]